MTEMIDTKLLLDSTRDLNVLYVEDNQELSAVTKDRLDIYFKQVDVAFNGEEGLNKYKKSFDQKSCYDLVITDINMPEINGIEMSRKILALNEIQSIIMITAFDSYDNLREAITLGVDAFIAKPLQVKQLLKILLKVSRTIADKKIIEQHIEQIEILNLELISKNKELEKSFRIIDTVIEKEIVKEKNIVKEKKISNIDKLHEFDDEFQSQTEQLMNEDLFELRETLDEIDIAIIEIMHDIDNVSSEDLKVLIENFTRYSTILYFYTFFHDLSISMSHFVDTMKNIPLPDDKGKIKDIFTFLEAFVYVLVKWQDEIASGDENKLNQLDASMISDMDTIVNFWTQKEMEPTDEDLDDIFDF